MFSSTGTVTIDKTRSKESNSNLLIDILTPITHLIIAYFYNSKSPYIVLLVQVFFQMEL
jgi:hypothetical protein